MKVTITLTKSEWEHYVELHEEKLFYTYSDPEDRVYDSYDVEETFLNSISTEDKVSMLWEADIEVES